jgi:benzoyl-CoA reductase/2-hydroxyglutaryl-CoA dehydratase subunit BcrC/BadD/HgdB
MEGLCSYARAWISEALADTHAAGIVLAMTCDQMRRAFEDLCANASVPCFLFNIPATWQTVQARQLYKSEIRRLGRFLEGLGGRTPSAEVLSGQMLRTNAGIVADADWRRRGDTPLALVGPHASGLEPFIAQILEAAGGSILLDCSEDSCPAFDRAAIQKDPFAELADTCFNSIQDVFQRPNSEFYKKLDHALRHNSVKGLVIRRYLWCDLWHAEVYRLKQWAPIPVLDLEIGYNPAEDSHRLATRIQSFMEMMQ